MQPESSIHKIKGAVWSQSPALTVCSSVPLCFSMFEATKEYFFNQTQGLHWGNVVFYTAFEDLGEKTQESGL